MLAVLALILSVLAGLPQDRVSLGSRGEAGMTALVAPSQAHAAGIASLAMGDPDDGFDDAVRMAIPAIAARQPAIRLHPLITAAADTAVPMLLERPPRLRV